MFVSVGDDVGEHGRLPLVGDALRQLLCKQCPSEIVSCAWRLVVGALNHMLIWRILRCTASVVGLTLLVARADCLNWPSRPLPVPRHPLLRYMRYPYVLENELTG